MEEIPAPALLAPQIGGYFIVQMEKKIISEKNPHGSIVKHEYNITQRLIRTINFLASISTLLNDLQNDGTHRTCIPANNPELNVTYYIYFLKFNKEKVKTFLYRQKNVKKYSWRNLDFSTSAFLLNQICMFYSVNILISEKILCSLCSSNGKYSAMLKPTISELSAI